MAIVKKVKDGTELSRCLPTNQRSCSNRPGQYFLQILSYSFHFLDVSSINGNNAYLLNYCNNKKYSAINEEHPCGSEFTTS